MVASSVIDKGWKSSYQGLYFSCLSMRYVEGICHPTVTWRPSAMPSPPNVTSSQLKMTQFQLHQEKVQSRMGLMMWLKVL